MRQFGLEELRELSLEIFYFIIKSYLTFWHFNNDTYRGLISKVGHVTQADLPSKYDVINANGGV